MAFVTNSQMLKSSRKTLLIIAALLAAPALAKQPRSHATLAEFQRQNPCPATGSHRGACPGYVRDHRIALCVGGEDKPKNIRWMTVSAAKAKDHWECKPGWEDRLKECEASGCFVQ
jgi:hypothetical protein